MNVTPIIFGRPVALTGGQIARAYAMRASHGPAATMKAARDLLACAKPLAARPKPVARTVSLAEVRRQGRLNMAKLCRSMGLEPVLKPSDR